MLYYIKKDVNKYNLPPSPRSFICVNLGSSKCSSKTVSSVNVNS